MNDIILLLLACVGIFILVALYFKNKNLKQSLQLLKLAQARALAREQEREKDQARWAKNYKTAPDQAAKTASVTQDRRRSPTERTVKKAAADKNKDQS